MNLQEPTYLPTYIRTYIRIHYIYTTYRQNIHYIYTHYKHSVYTLYMYTRAFGSSKIGLEPAELEVNSVTETLKVSF